MMLAKVGGALRRRLIGPRSALAMLPAAYHRSRGTVVEVDGVYLEMDRGLSKFMANVLRSGLHAVPERKLVMPALEADDVVMELGGGVGHTSTRFGRFPSRPADRDAGYFGAMSVARAPTGLVG